MTTDFTLRDGVRQSCNGSENPAPGLVQFMKRSDEPTYIDSTGHTSVSAGQVGDGGITQRTVSGLLTSSLQERSRTLSRRYQWQGGRNGPEGWVVCINSSSSIVPGKQADTKYRESGHGEHNEIHKSSHSDTWRGRLF